MLFSEAIAYRADYLKRIEEIETPFIQRLNVLRKLMIEANLLNRYIFSGGDVEWDEDGIYFTGYSSADGDESTRVPESALDLSTSEYPAWIQAEVKRREDTKREKEIAKANARAEQEAVWKLQQEQTEYEIYLKIKEQVEKGAKREG